MAPPLAASSEDEQVDIQVEEEQKKKKRPSAMKKLKSDPKTSHSSSSSDDDDDSEPATPIASKPNKDALKPSSSDPKTSSNDDDDDEEVDDDQTPPPQPKPIASKVSSNTKKHSLVSQNDSKLKKKKQKKVLDGNEGKPEIEKCEKKKKKVVDGNEGEPEKEECEKKKKVVDGNEGEPEKEECEKKKNVIIQRIWSDEDEIVLLKGLLENKNKGGIDVLSNLNEFLETIKESLQFKEVKEEQLKNKIQRLRKKFVNSSKRAKGDKIPVFSKPHEQVSYKLMKEIWGVGGGNSVNADGKDDDDDDDDSVVVVNVRRSSSRIMKSQNDVGTKCHASPLMDLDDSNEDGNAVKEGDFEQKWRCLIVDELKLYLRRVELVQEQTVAILDAHKSSDASEVHE